MARTKNAKVPEVGTEVPEFNLPSAQGGSLRLGMRTAMGPVVVAFFRGAENEEDVSFFKKLAAKEDEINLAIGNIVGIGVVESAAAREFVEATGMKSYILYDYAKVATPAWGLFEKDKENGDHARPATFLVDSENKVVAAWMEERPDPDELLAKVSEITGLPKEPEDEAEEKPKRAKASEKADESGESADASEKPKREKLSPEEREKRRAERKAARESGDASGDANGDAKAEGGKPKAASKAENGGSDEESGESAGEAGTKPEKKSGDSKPANTEAEAASSESESEGGTSGGTEGKESGKVAGEGADSGASGGDVRGEKKEGS